MTALLNIHSALGAPAEPLSPAHVPTIARTYALIFFFLAEFMDWYVRRSTCQVLKCHSQDVYAEFHHLVKAIQHRARDLPRSADAMIVDRQGDTAYGSRAQWEESQLSQVGRQGQQRRIATQNTMTRRLIWEIQHDAEERTRIRDQRHDLLLQMMNSASAQLHPVSEQSSGIVCMATTAPDLGRRIPSPELGSATLTNALDKQRRPRLNGLEVLNAALPASSSKPDPNISRSFSIATTRSPTLNRMSKWRPKAAWPPRWKNGLQIPALRHLP